MHFKIRAISKDIQDVQLRVDHSNVIDLGLYNEKERRQLAFELQEAIDELLRGLEQPQDA
jgi:hypothetical protein